MVCEFLTFIRELRKHVCSLVTAVIAVAAYLCQWERSESVCNVCTQLSQAACTVVTMTSKSIEKRGFLIPCISEIPDNFITKIGYCD